jgi:plastocyanin
MALAAGFMVLMVLARLPIPPLAIYVLLVGGGLAVRRRKPTVGVVLVGASTLLISALNAAIMVDSLSRPRDPVDFTLAVLGWAAALCTAVAIVPAVRRRPASTAPEALSVVAAAAVILALAVSVIGWLTLDQVAAVSGDTEVVIAETAFPPTVTAAAGDSAVFIDNRDPYAHTFTVDELGVNQTLVAGQSARVAISAAPGEYRYYCAIPGHEFMEGTLLVQ